MEHLIETVSLDIEEQNELDFRVKIESTNSLPRIRLVCESGDVSYMFSGHSIAEEDGVVRFALPEMKDKITEGIFPARIEVLVENRYFIPAQFQIAFKKSVKVVAESIVVVQKSQKQDVSVTAGPIVVRQLPSKVLPESIVKTENKPVIQQTSNTNEKTKIQLKSIQEQVAKPGSLKDRYQQKSVKS